MAFKIRPYQDPDLSKLYDICLKTADSGQDASHLYDDPKLVGDAYAAPYAVLEPDLTFVLEDAEGVCGYILGAFESSLFYERMKTDWLPTILARHPRPEGDASNFNADERLLSSLYTFNLSLLDILKDYPSHLHIDLLPRAQKQGQGKALMLKFLETLKQKGSKGVHLGVGKKNSNAIAFYKKMGFEELQTSKTALWMIKSL